MRVDGSLVRGVLLAAVALALVPGCRSRATREDPAFLAAWEQLAERGVDPVVVGDEPAGAALLDSVHRGARKRAARPAAAGPTMPALPSEAVPGLPTLPGQPATPAPAAPAVSDEDVARVIRSSMGGLKQCYRQAESALSDGGGKAIVRFKIMPTGAVDGVRVEAPAFEASRLPSCISSQVRGWRFPTFEGDPVSVSYPFVFSGG